MSGMQFISTRGQAPACGFEAVLLTGLAPDGGLYMPGGGGGGGGGGGAAHVKKTACRPLERAMGTPRSRS